MTAAQDATKQLEQQALGQLRALHSTIIETARRRSEQIAKAGPDARYYARMLGLPKDLAEQQQAAIDNSFAFAEKVLELQHQFAPDGAAGPRHHHPLPGHEAKRLLAALERTAGNVREAAKLLGISRGGFYVKLKKLGLNPDEYR